MQRGILILNKEELNQLFTVLDISVFTGTQLFEKLNSASGSIEPEVRILLSEDELESIIDEMGMPFSNNQVLNSALEKINALMLSFRD
ncbi:hypothetical protein A2400_02765 [candidate division WS6 bacterium RIFOXYB1_FULL_33_14]|uniref:Uncharacterized protein n=1 Tax=candidate division WS6 bacterium RIFOXYB1_FULL_33_14 TaxID=1817896 RepID=A0A1F4UJ82_9BACT|nr:MAG: hypothetical protein A2400_02765 [candidate division WS6 bacterium RIFOXYB1_FULL_33_14]